MNTVTTGDTLPELQVTVTAQKIIAGAAATRDWQPIHHDHDAAVKAGLRGVIMNSPTQAGWISKYITDWAGPQAVIRRMAFRMKDSIYAGEELLMTGEITGKDNNLVTATVTVRAGEKVKTIAEVRFSVPD